LQSDAPIRRPSRRGRGRRRGRSRGRGRGRVVGSVARIAHAASHRSLARYEFIRPFILLALSVPTVFWERCGEVPLGAA